MAIVSILMIAIASALSFSINVSTGRGAVNQANLLSAADAADQVSDDLHVALNFSEHTSNSITFSVPDRTGNGTPDQIRYAWDGVSGHPLTRQYLAAPTPILTAGNATATPITLLGGVTNFGLNYLTRQMGTAATTDSLLVVSSATLLGSNNNYNIDSTHWCSQSLTVPLPLFSTSYTITRIQVLAKSSSGQDGTMKMRVTTSVSGKPGTVLQEVPFYESALSTGYEYAEVKFTNLTNLPAGQPICVVIGYTSGSSTIGTLQYQTALLSILSGFAWSTSSDGGTTWTSPSSTSNMYMTIYGTCP
jgi:hypothetical protein